MSRSTQADPQGRPTATTVAVVASSHGDPAAPHSGGWSGQVTQALIQPLTAAGIAHRFYGVGSGERSFARLAGALAAAESDAVAAVAVVDPNASPVWDDIAAAFGRSSPRPVVFIAAAETTLPAVVVHHNQRRAGHDAALHLIDAGYRHLVALQPYHEPWLAQRVRGIRDACAQTRADGVRLHVEAAIVGARLAWWADMAPAQRQHLLAVRFAAAQAAAAPAGEPIGVLAANDAMALDLIDLVGLRPGGDCGLIGYDGSPRTATLGLSTMEPPLADLGLTAARLLLDAIAGRTLPSLTRLPSRLVARASSMR